jgi:hypothetical protein
VSGNKRGAPRAAWNGKNKKTITNQYNVKAEGEEYGKESPYKT